MKSKKLIYLTILLIGLLAITSVHASEDIGTINELTTDNVNEISDEENNVNGFTVGKDNLQANNIEPDNLQAKANDIIMPSGQINVTGKSGMKANITVNIIKNSTRVSNGNITLSGLETAGTKKYYNISLNEGDNFIILSDFYVYDGRYSVYYKDQNGSWSGEIKVVIIPPPKEVTHFEANSKTIYKNDDMVYIGTLKDSNNNPVIYKYSYQDRFFIKVNSEYLTIYDEEEYYNNGCDCYIDSNDGKIYVSNKCFKIGENAVILEFEESAVHNSSNKTITITKKDKFTIKAPNYNSFYTSKKKLKITASQKVKMKIVFKNKKTKKTKTYYVTGTTNYKIPVGCGKYSVTITSANPYYTSNKRIINVTVNKYTTFKHGKYSIKVHYKTMKKIQNAYLKQIEDWKGISKKIKGKYYTWKQPIYKTIKVKKTGYKYKYVKYSEGYYYDGGSEYEYYKVKAPKGYKYCGIYTKWSNNYNHVINYYKFKKKTTYYTTKDVISRYKKHKEPVYKTVEYDGLMGSCYFSIGNFYKTYYYRNINKYFKV